MKKIAHYIRVSTQEQANNWFWKDSQLTQLEKYTQYHFNQEDVDWKAVIYSDLGISGWKDENERPWLKKLLKDIEDWIINTVIVRKLDRLARKSIILLDLVEYFDSYEIDFISVTEQVNTKTAQWRFFISILWAMAEMERSDIAEKTRFWKIESLKKWNFSMGGSPMYWFRKNINTKKLEIHEEEAEVIRDIFDMHVNQNKTLGDISKILELRKIPPWISRDSDWNEIKKDSNWPIVKISRILSCEAYIWNYNLNKTWTKQIIKKSEEKWKSIKKSEKVLKNESEWIPINVESIISVDLFLEAQRKQDINKYRFNNRNKPVINHIFTWLLKCSCCWSNYKGAKGKKKNNGDFHIYYRCWRTNWYRFKDKKCNNWQIREIELIDNIYNSINKILLNPKNVVETYLSDGSIEININKYRKEIIEIKNKLEDSNVSIWELYSEWSEEKNQNLKNILKTQIESQKVNIEILEQRQIELEMMVSKQETLKMNTKEVSNFIKMLKIKDIYQIPREEQMEILSKMIEKIIIKENEVEVYFVFHIKDNTEFEDKKNSKIIKISPSATTKMVAMVILPP